MHTNSCNFVRKGEAGLSGDKASRVTRTDGSKEARRRPLACGGEMREELGRGGIPTSRLHAPPGKERTDGQSTIRSGRDCAKLSSLRVADEDGVHFPFAGVAPPPASPLSPSPAATPRVPLRPGRGGSDPSVPPVSQRSLDSPLGLACRPRSPWGRFDPYDSPEDRDKEYVGFATLPNQVHRKAAKKGFTFTLMVAGESGLGKSTLIDSLFLADLYKDRKIPAAEERIRQTVSTVKRTVSIEEKGVKLRLSVVDTPGFGDAVDNTRSWKHLEDYVERQFDQFFRDESGLDRRNIRDNRVHCCLYFISPHGHGLRPLDVECLRALHDKVNVVPVLAKADSLTQVEVRRKKSKVREELRRFGINIYPFAGCDSDDDDDFKRRDRLLKDSVPFAVIGSGVLAESRGRRVKGRTYPWGVAEVESPAHSDFLLLRDMLVRTHMQDLKDVTRESHYENYRACCIRNMTRMVARDPELCVPSVEKKATRTSRCRWPPSTRTRIDSPRRKTRSSGGRRGRRCGAAACEAASTTTSVSVGFLFADASACLMRCFVIHCHCFYCHLVANDNQALF
ncbi:septin-5-like isoform X6 [Phyllopteryx taeniolatus]|uniref:septin-5-like isoform X6 n=1 Tax=Phyllopteryx taeniolatus TaxID=161469 RepID=UPI002AD386D1|nr:septin-5-like isoform X6 [Phyllopteryx taeniolatus]